MKLYPLPSAAPSASAGPARANAPSTRRPAHLRLRVWDRFVRCFHWSLVSCVLINYFVADDGEDLHQWLGYTASALVVARIAWGFVGTRHARFSDFFPTPRRLIDHLQALRAGRIEFHPGHNPLGALMMLALIVTVLGLGLTGYLQGTDRFWGEAWLQDLHAWLGDGLIALAGLHGAAALVMGRLERVKLITAMITGVKQRY